MTWPAVVTSVLGAVLILGGIGVAWTWWKWHEVAELIPDMPMKVGATLVKYAGGVASLASTYAGAAHKDEWFVPAAAGLGCAVIWEVLDKLIDHRRKAAEREDREALARADRECESRTELLYVFRDWVTEKTRRLMRKVSDRRDKPSVAQVSAALTPDEHIEDLLRALTAYAREQLPADGPEICNFRVGLYVDHDGVMTPLHAVDLGDTPDDVFRAHGTNVAAFRRDAGGHSVVRGSVRELAQDGDCRRLCRGNRARQVPVL